MSKAATTATSAVGAASAMGVALPLGGAAYLDGSTGRRLDVTLAADGPELVILRTDGRELDRWPGADLRPMPDAGPMVLGLGGDGLAAIEVTDDSVRNRLRAAFPDSGGAAHRRPPRIPLMGWLAGAAVSLALILFVLIPALAVPLSRLVPDWLQAEIGEGVAEIIGAIFVEAGDPLVCQAPAGTTAMNRIMERLTAADNEGAPPLQVRVIGSGVVNAFAAPGGHIGIPLGMIKFAESPEALAAVIAHEVGHVVNGDSMVRVMRVGLMSVLVSLVTGDASGGLAAALVVQVLESGYSQEQERQADLYAATTLVRANLPVEPFADLFDRLDRQMGPLPDWVGWVGSHPETASRVAELRAIAPPAAVRPLLSADEWTALQGICGEAGERIEMRLPGSDGEKAAE